MPTKLTYFGHSCLQIDDGYHRLLFDPFLTDNPASTTADTLNPTHVLVSHGHGDHIADAASIAKRTGATVISNFEIVNWLQAQGVEHAHPMNYGGPFTLPFGTVEFTLAHHSSALPDGSYGGNPGGFLIHLNAGPCIYFAGDTSLFSDMSLIGDEGIDLAMLPIGGNFTMNPARSLRAIELLSPKSVMPIHFNTWPVIAQDAEAWASEVRSRTNARPIVLKPGESSEI